MPLIRFFRRNRSSLLARTALFLALAVFAGGCGKAGAAADSGAKGKGSGKKGRGATAARIQPVEVVKAEKRDLIESINLVGSLAVNETAQIRAEIAGQVREVLFDEGQIVKAGQLLLRIDDSELRAQLAQSEAKFSLASQNLKRIQNLTTQQFISEAEADKTRSDFDAATAEVLLLRVRLDKMQIKAPFDGIAGARTVSPGDFVNVSMTATPITTIDDLSRMKIEFQVPERLASRVKPGTRFNVSSRTPAGMASTTGVVYFASSIIDRTTRTTQVKGYLDTIPEGFRPGMYASVELELDTRAGVFTVPEGAILITAATGPQIVVARENNNAYTADFIPVETGLRTRGVVEVKPLRGGIDEDTLVVASGVGALILYQGGRLEPRPLRKEFTLGGPK